MDNEIHPFGLAKLSIKNKKPIYFVDKSTSPKLIPKNNCKIWVEKFSWAITQF
jgi:hypothetical protein